MNKPKGIEWTDYTFNPIVGCTANCPYCYARQAAQRLPCPDCQEFRPHFHPERLADLKKGKPGRVFMGSMGDMFDPEVDPDWWRQILEAHYRSLCINGGHELMVLTKRPDRINETMEATGIARWWRSPGLRKLFWFGVTVTRQEDDWRIKELLEVPAAGHFVSLEPLLGPVDILRAPIGQPGGQGYDPVVWPDWLIIGGLSGSWLPNRTGTWSEYKWERKKFQEFEAQWANDVIEQAQAAGVPVFVKTKPVKLPGVPDIQEWPEGLKEADDG